MYPENTLTSFGKAMEIKGISGVELDIQLTKDGELVVIHDERVDRTTDGFGFVRDYTLKELQALHIFAGKGVAAEKIPTMREVIELLMPRLKVYCDAVRQGIPEDEIKDGMRINIELKTSVYNYPGC